MKDKGLGGADRVLQPRGMLRGRRGYWHREQAPEMASQAENPNR